MTDLDGGTAAPISVISRAAPNALPEGEMDALLLGRTRVSVSYFNQLLFFPFHICK